MSNAQHAEPIIECCPLAPTLPLVCSGQALQRRPQLQSLRCSKIAHYSWSCLNLLTWRHGPMPLPTHHNAALIFPVLPSVSTRGRPCGKYIAEGGVASVMGVAYSGILWHTLAYSGILWHTLAYSGILWHTLAYSGILWHTLAYSGILWHALAYSGIINASF